MEKKAPGTEEQLVPVFPPVTVNLKRHSAHVLGMWGKGPLFTMKGNCHLKNDSYRKYLENGTHSFISMGYRLSFLTPVDQSASFGLCSSSS